MNNISQRDLSANDDDYADYDADNDGADDDDDADDDDNDGADDDDDADADGTCDADCDCDMSLCFLCCGPRTPIYANCQPTRTRTPL